MLILGNDVFVVGHLGSFDDVGHKPSLIIEGSPCIFHLFRLPDSLFLMMQDDFCLNLIIETWLVMGVTNTFSFFWGMFMTLPSSVLL